MNVTLTLLSGFGITCLIFILTLLLSLPLGLLIAFGGMSKFKPLSYLIKTIVWIIRGTPLMLQVMVVFYAPGLLLGWSGLKCTTATVIAFVINYSCYFSEIYRGGIESVAKSQSEAGQVLGMTKSQIFFKVILLQVIKRILPPMSNEIITLVKDTSLARVIAVEEILFMAFNRFVSKGIIWPLFYSGVFFLIFVGILTILFNWLEKKLSYFKA
ncbi:MAG: amino acid ABC transporter permease [Firmicutes bacterium]|nr:amino acid ABC transporter permease [Candidatus Caballimonas caccae]